MNKLAVFVEGKTEVLFIERLIEEICGKKNVLIEQRQIRGGSTCERSVLTIKAARPETNHKYFVLIYDCGGDESVKARICEEHENLNDSGYSRIIGLRDVRGKLTYADIPQLEKYLPMNIEPSLIPVDFILAIMEIEAWFLAETTHYQKIAPAITVAAIKASLGFDPENDDLEQRPKPADDLNNCYMVGGKRYTKPGQDTVDVLDFALIYMQFQEKFRYVGKLISSIEAFLT